MHLLFLLIRVMYVKSGKLKNSILRIIILTISPAKKSQMGT